jgi:hypothetical protein
LEQIKEMSMKPLRSVAVAVAFSALSLTAVAILAHGDANRTEQLKNTPDPRTATEKADFQSRNSLEQLAQLNAELVAMKKQLGDEDLYACCIYGGCNMCPLGEAQCACRKNLEAGESVCVECKDGWVAGKGSVEGYGPDDVKTMFGAMGGHGEGHDEEEPRRREHEH